MQNLSQFIVSIFSYAAQNGQARILLERAATARGLSQGDAAELRSNAMALLSMVR